MEKAFDLVIIGGGINGCGCAANAAMRGLNVLLCEQDDLASKTSSSSSKLIHGGLRYLEYYDFALVKKALDEQQTLLTLAPHLVRPQAFMMPHAKNSRPLWLLRAGLFIYDHLSRKNTLPNTQFIHHRRPLAYFSPVNDTIKSGFIFYDCTTDDARLTIANALQAREHGATVLTHTKLTSAKVDANQWCLTLKPQSGSAYTIRTKAVINAAGPWATSVDALLQINTNQALSLVKGSHIVVPKLYEGEHAYVLQHTDKRIVFVIPYHGFTMVGTTDVDFNEALDKITIDAKETAYLCNIINRYFKKTVQARDIIHTWSGIRPLLSSPGKPASALSRDYSFHYAQHPAPSLTLYGGKITTYRQLADDAIDALRPTFPSLAPSQSHITPLPGATLHEMNFTDYRDYARNQYAWLDAATAERLLSAYGTKTEHLLAGCKQMADLGHCFIPTLYQKEVDYLVKHEWATNAEDILWRRSKLGLGADDAACQALEDYLSTEASVHDKNRCHSQAGRRNLNCQP